jgi:hypothetical protein
MFSLSTIRIVAGALFTLSAGQGLNVTFDNQPNSVVTYLAFYGAAALLALLIVATTVVIQRRKSDEPVPSAGNQYTTSYNQSGGITAGQIVRKGDHDG